jgi:hypothetical protein
MFELRHEPGVMGISDFTELKGMTITIAGKAFEHLLYHYRLAYSGVPLKCLRFPQAKVKHFLAICPHHSRRGKLYWLI